MPRSKRTLLTLKFVTLGVSLLLAFLCVEILVRISGNDRPLVWRPDPQRGWRHIPGAKLRWTEEGDGLVEINALGLRDPERTVAKKPGTYRIAVFGDSMTEAIQVNLEQTYTQLLEKRLRARGWNVEVINFGVSGYSPLQGYLTFDAVGKAFLPDLVLHAVFTDNDIADCVRSLAAGQVGAPFAVDDESSVLNIDYSGAIASSQDYDRQPIYAIRRWSATYRMLGAVVRTRRGVERFQATLESTGGVPKRHLVYLDPAGPDWNTAWRLYEQIMVAFVADARSIGSKFAVISVPAGQVVDQRVWTRVMSDFPAMASKRWNVLGPDERLRQLGVAHGIPVLDPLSFFKSRVQGAPMFFGGQDPSSQNGLGHMTARGHEVMAEALENLLVNEALLPRPRNEIDSGSGPSRPGID